MDRGPILVIGYGNDLRGDDAAGRVAADRVELWALPGVDVRSLPQLTPELAEPLAAARWAVFLDAYPADARGGVRVHPLTPADRQPPLGHTADPQLLLAYAQRLFGRAPEAWWITLPAADFALGAPLSPLAEDGVAAGLAAVRRLLGPPAGREDVGESRASETDRLARERGAPRTPIEEDEGWPTR